MSDQQRPATKPAHLRTFTSNAASSGPSPAIRGATSAFAPKSSTTTGISIASALPLSSASPSSAGARYAARAVASSVPKPLSVPSSSAQNVNRNTSPERGRSFQPEKIIGKDTAGTTPSHRSAMALVDSTPRHISPSAIAARYASSQSPSPSPSRSPQRSPVIRPGSRLNDSSSRSKIPSLPDPALGALTSSATSPPEDEFELVPVRNRILNFEAMPSLSPTSRPVSRVNEREATKRPAIGALQQLSPSNSTLDTTAWRDRSRSVTSSLPSPPELSRRPSNASALSTASTSILDSTFRQPLQLRSIHHTGRTRAPYMTSANYSHSGLTVNNLANAMVASSIASSRAASPANKPPPPPASRRRSRSFSALYDITAQQRAPVPPKPRKPPRPMKHTLRKQTNSDDDDEPELVKRGRRHWMRKHPHMHAEGDRKRWRDKVLERERKRYEGVFAANRGLLIGSGHFEPTPSNIVNASEGNRVANVIVRDIWERSRLPQDVLMEIYDLVAPEDDRALSRDQFVVGMWLIDQRLKGRKLPVKVSASVWASVRHPDGINLKHRGM